MGNSTWLPVIENVLPRDDGTHANDSVTDPWWIHDIDGWRPEDGPERRVRYVDISLAIEDGTGSNTWTVEPVIVFEEDRTSDNRKVWPVPSGLGICVAPKVFDDTELPLRRHYRVPVRLGCYALRITRSGAGTRRLRVRVLASV